MEVHSLRFQQAKNYFSRRHTQQVSEIPKIPLFPLHYNPVIHRTSPHLLLVMSHDHHHTAHLSFSRYESNLDFMMWLRVFQVIILVPGNAGEKKSGEW